MLKRTLKFKNYDGEDREFTAYFHISEGELVEWMVRKDTDGGETDIKALLQKVVDSKNGGQLMDAFTDIVKLAYGVKTDSGGFRKTDQVFQDFRDSGAWHDFLMDLLTDANKSAEFINGILPADILKAATEKADARVEQEKRMEQQVTAPLVSSFGPAADLVRGGNPVDEEVAPVQPKFDPFTGAPLT